MRKLLLDGLLKRPLTEPAPPPDDAGLAELASRIRRKLGRSLSIREVDAGSCNGCELEIHALNNAFYDLDRFGIRFVASPRHADVLLVTGPVTKNMREALERTWNATPDPKWVVAVGDCALDGGLFAGSYAVEGGVSSVVPVDLHIRGCPALADRPAAGPAGAAGEGRAGVADGAACRSRMRSAFGDPLRDEGALKAAFTPHPGQAKRDPGPSHRWARFRSPPDRLTCPIVGWPAPRPMA